MKKSKAHPHKYDFDIQWSDEDGCYVSRVLEIPGCVADGDTVKEAAENIEAVLELFLQTYKSTDTMPPSPAERIYPDQFIVRLDPILHKRLVIRAKRQKKSRNAFLNDLILQEVLED